MYKLKEKYKNMVAKYYTKSSLDVLNGVYDLETWNKNGYMTCILEKVKTEKTL
jgi:hypothetical protein